ncbi:Uncharacterised protein [Leclercia adecarboxylata]|uniref:Uncharacterized protein n=1 Tax=Leclercia adecarboxylata TaxID=83655 RepID=A0A4U9I3L8_9ENTR|nr:Uncharacterised protein [Leclercia adecarboxylata]
MTRGFIARLRALFAEVERRMNLKTVSESVFDEVHVLQRRPEMNCENLRNLLRKEGAKNED